jgi:Hermansky-Pudlak syndrome 1 protein
MQDEHGSKLRAKFVSRVKSYSPQPTERVYQQVFLSSNQHQPRSLYCAKLHDRVTLVIITSNTQTSESEKHDLIKVESAVRESIMENYASYLLSVENSFTMISYMHQLPGLVHFIFVDRTSNRILAPGISSLIGNASKYNTAHGREQMLSTLKGYIWQMCYQGYESLSKGFFDMVMKYGDFQFSYKLWFEDLAGNRLTASSNDVEEKGGSIASDAALGRTEESGPDQRTESPARRRRNNVHSHISSKEPIARDFYKKLQKSLFPQGNVKCYELFCLYIGSVSLKIIDQYNSNLIGLLTEKRQ